ncbi:alpha/beta hydrolase family protein [Bacteroidota bacterium]
MERRNFIKSGIATVGAGIMGNTAVFAADCPVDTLEAPGPIPLNDLLSDYLQVTEKWGQGLKKVTICDKESWKSKRQSVLQRARIMLGEAPQANRDDFKTDILSETQRNGYKEIKVQFPSGTGDVIKGYLLVPDKATSSSPRPAIIALHSTGPGASQTVGLTPREGRDYGMELAQRGYVVLAIDVISAGERVYPGYDPYYTNEFYKEFPGWSAMGKMIHDHSKGLDYLCSLDIVDPNRLGCIGHSLGGYNSFFLQAFDSRIKAAVSSCGFSPMGQSTMPYQFARDDWFIHFNPNCRDYIRAGMIPCDMHEIMALCAPRPFFNYSAKKDAVYFPPLRNTESDFGAWWQTVDVALMQVSQIYEILGVPDHFVRVETDGGHDFPQDVREDAYRWLDKWLGN